MNTYGKINDNQCIKRGKVATVEYFDNRMCLPCVIETMMHEDIIRQAEGVGVRRLKPCV